MYEVIFYRDRSGREPILEYIQELTQKSDKSSRIKANKVLDHIRYLKKVGMQAREPYVKHLGNGIFELRPIRDRILYAAWDGRTFILLHHFMKKTQKTPLREIEQARKNLLDYKERSKRSE